MEVKRTEFQWDDGYSIFASPDFLRTVSGRSGSFGWIGGFEGTDLRYVMPYILKRRLIFSSLRFQAGPIAIAGETEPEGEKDFLNGLLPLLKDLKIDLVQSPPTYFLSKEYPDKAIAAPYASYVLGLEKPEHALWANLHSKHRNVIRKAMDQVIIKRGKEYSDIAYRLIADTLKRSNMAFVAKDEYDATLTSLGRNTEVFVAFYGGEPQGCAVIPFSQYSAYYRYGGSVENPFTGAMNFLHWEAIRYFKSIDVKRYDFVGARIHPKEGSKQEGLKRFKMRFGGTMQKGYLWRLAVQPYRYALYRFLYLLRNRFQGDIIDQECKINAERHHSSDQV